MKEDISFRRQKSDIWLLSLYSNAFNRSNNRDCSLRMHLFLSSWFRSTLIFLSCVRNIFWVTMVIQLKCWNILVYMGAKLILIMHLVNDRYLKYFLYLYLLLAHHLCWIHCPGSVSRHALPDRISGVSTRILSGQPIPDWLRHAKSSGKHLYTYKFEYVTIKNKTQIVVVNNLKFTIFASLFHIAIIYYIIDILLEG